MLEDKKIVVYSHDENSSYENDHPDSLLEFQSWFEEQKKKIPEGYLSNARIKIEAEAQWDSVVLMMEIYYFRPETEEEQTERQLEKQQNLKRTEEKERRQLAILKKKYDD